MLCLELNLAENDTDCFDHEIGKDCCKFLFKTTGTLIDINIIVNLYIF
jgi:hypothetical protein